MRAPRGSPDASVADPSLSDTVTVTVADAEYPTTRLDAQLKDGAN